ncbi:nucleotidyl transferase AbiEii/AbiGii toxin family protein [Novosphingobium sp. Gsoil 351]|uniref:nucleotidyl transferase AbiEii/AbiGii toxin family protein n=1 Tax=Novosphingobium sp. Gsoil 351 TaxID=2675225 RepID=UPI0012B4A5E7|nr:nucleotidyl transferase AbiEii/AbiGii toxin family protein [Novosphingobium sp. Gsoil 351]QGN54060.1 nucleotidyl transferase AbiEii/AbiGii toxin family protein [Novosphingobium sp. Gsoil 351]
MARPPVNIAKSVKDRLLNIARQEGRAFDVLLVRFALERLLYRLSISPHREQFVLKGGMLVTAWIDDDNRVTRDADFLGFGDADPHKLIADFRGIMVIEGGDGLVFDTGALTATAIRDEMEYGGVRIKTAAYLERTRISVIIDIGFGDAMAVTPQQLDFPTLLDLPVPRIRAYPPSTVIAEKFQAMVALGVLNSRMKDYYDLWAIPRNVVIAPEDLDAAILATFTRRGTAIPTERPPGLSTETTQDQAKRRQWSAYAKSLELEGVAFGTVADAVWAYVGPSCERLTVNPSVTRPE